MQDRLHHGPPKWTAGALYRRGLLLWGQSQLVVALPVTVSSANPNKRHFETSHVVPCIGSFVSSQEKKHGAEVLGPAEMQD